MEERTGAQSYLRLLLSVIGVLLSIGLSSSTISANSWPASDVAQASQPQLTPPGISPYDCPTNRTEIVPSPNVAAGANSLSAIAAIAPDDMWAVGTSQNGIGTKEALFQHWDGTQWSIVPYVGIGLSSLNAVSALTTNDVWAVGALGTSTSLTMHWDGAQWSVIASPSPSAGGALYGVAAISTNDIWAVGQDGLAMHWDGVQWAILPTPGIQGRTIRLQAVSGSSSSDVWTVGHSRVFLGGVYYYYTLTMHWDGTEWSIIPTQNYWQSDDLLGVKAIAGNDVWAVGKLGPGGLALHWDGAQWNTVPNPSPELRFTLSGISASSTDNVWAVGSVENTQTFESDAVTMRWDGVQWSAVPRPAVEDSGHSKGVVALSSDNVWVVGLAYGSPTGQALALIEHWDGTQVSVFPHPDVRMGVNYLSDVEVISAKDIWAVGQYKDPVSIGHNKTLTMHGDGIEWAVVPSPNPSLEFNGNFLSGVSAISSNDVWAVGGSRDGSSTDYYSLVIHWDGTQWATVSVPQDDYLSAVEAISSNDVWATGYKEYSATESRSKFLHWDGTNWTGIFSDELAGVQVFLYSITAVSPTDIWAVGSKYTNTLTMHYDGAAWSRVPSPNGGTGYNILRSVKAISANDVWAVGYYGPQGSEQPLIMHWDGSVWGTVPSPGQGDSSFLLGVDPFSESNIWAAGNYLAGGVSHTFAIQWNGSQWSVVSTPDAGNQDNYLSAVAALSPNQAWAVGNYKLDTSILTLAERLDLSIYADVPLDNPFYSYVQCMACRGIISGYADGTFRPNNDITRGQLSKIVSNSAGFNDDPGPQLFEDVPSDSTFYYWVQRLANRGHIGGYPCGGETEPCGPENLPYFRPNANATRGQISKIVSNAAGFTDTPPDQTFEDVSASNPFYLWIERLASRGIMSGYPCGGPNEPCGQQGKPYFRWGNNATRGQTAKIVANTFFPGCETPGRN